MVQETATVLGTGSISATDPHGDAALPLFVFRIPAGDRAPLAPPAWPHTQAVPSHPRVFTRT